MAEFVGEDLRGSRFERTDLSGSEFRAVDLRHSRFRGVDLNGVVMRGVEITHTTIDGEIEDVVINGVDVAPLVEAELDRRFPDRVLFRPTTADGFRQAWDLNERLWAATVDRARRLPDGHVTALSADSTVGMRAYVTGYEQHWDQLFAASVIAIVPVAILFTLIEKHLVGGLTAGSVK